MKSSIRWTVFAASLLLIGGAQSASAGDLEKCNRTVPDLNSCTRVIKSGRESGKSLGILYNNRAVAYLNKCQYKRAIADSKKATALDPKLAGPYYVRGLANMYSGSGKAAVQDFKRAAALGKNFKQLQSSFNKLYKAKVIRVDGKFSKDLETNVRTYATLFSGKNRC